MPHLMDFKFDVPLLDSTEFRRLVAESLSVLQTSDNANSHHIPTPYVQQPTPDPTPSNKLPPLNASTNISNGNSNNGSSVVVAPTPNSPTPYSAVATPEHKAFCLTFLQFAERNWSMVFRSESDAAKMDGLLMV